MGRPEAKRTAGRGRARLASLATLLVLAIDAPGALRDGQRIEVSP